MPDSSSRPRELRLDGRRALGVLDAAYRLDLDEDAWLDGLTGAIAPAIDEGSGVHAFFVERGRLSGPRLHGGDPAWAASWREVWWEALIEPMDVATIDSLSNFGPLSYTRDLYAATARSVPTFDLLLGSVGASQLDEGLPPSVGRYPDSLNLVAIDVCARGVAICANRERRSEEPPAAAAVERAGLLAAHVAAAIRLRALRPAERSILDSSDVVLSDRGAVVDVRPGAELDSRLDELRHAAQTVVRSRRESGDDADGRASLALWQVLFAKTFSVVDVFERDGRRYLVANRNRPAPKSALARLLTPRELQVVTLVRRGRSNKLIGYELGIEPSTVANHLASASEKLGVHGTRELIAALRASEDAHVEVPTSEGADS